MMESILEYNRRFVAKKGYEPYLTDKYPSRKLAILSCMDTRLTELLPAALGLKNGDAKVIKNAGAVISSPFGSVMRSLMVAVYDLGVEDILVIGHRDCGASALNSGRMIGKMKERGISEETLRIVSHCGVDLHDWLRGFDCVDDSVRSTVRSIVEHPLMPKDIHVYGLVMDPVTGELSRVV